MSNHNTTLSITANEIAVVRTGSQSITVPTVDENTTDATVQRIDLDGHIFTGLVMENVRGDAEVIVDLQNGITYDLVPEVIKTSPADEACDVAAQFEALMNPYSGLPENVR